MAQVQLGQNAMANMELDDELAPGVNGAAIQERVRAYWNSKPCDSDLSDREPSSREYFLEIEQRRYSLQPHIPVLLSKIDWSGKRVLEIGAGVGTDARAIIGKGGIYTGINIDRASTEATAQALHVFALPGSVRQCDATAIPFPSGTFDVVYAFGVLHHIVDAGKAVAEIHRVLKPGGEFLTMLYNRASINYIIEIMFLRKLGLYALEVPGATALLGRMGFPRDKIERHKALHRSKGRIGYSEWLSRNTNGPDNPYAQVFGAREAAQLLEPFQIVSNDVYFFDHRHWGLLGKLVPARARSVLGRAWGWHRIVHARKVADPDG